MIAFSVSCPSAAGCPSAGSCPPVGSCPGSARSAAGATASVALPAAVAPGAGPSVAVARDGSAARRALGPRDRERCAGLATAGARRDFRAGRLAARRAVAGLVAGSGRVEGVSKRVEGGSGRVEGVRVSLAHRGGRGLAAAVAPGAAVGVDLEREGAVAPRETRYFLTARERAACRGLDPTELWTLAEALWKLLELSRRVPFHALEAVPDPAEGVVHVRHGGRGLRALRARYRIVRPWPGWVGAVVWRGGEG